MRTDIDSSSRAIPCILHPPSPHAPFPEPDLATVRDTPLAPQDLRTRELLIEPVRLGSRIRFRSAYLISWKTMTPEVSGSLIRSRICRRSYPLSSPSEYSITGHPVGSAARPDGGKVRRCRPIENQRTNSTSTCEVTSRERHPRLCPLFERSARPREHTVRANTQLCGSFPNVVRQGDK